MKAEVREIIERKTFKVLIWEEFSKNSIVVPVILILSLTYIGSTKRKHSKPA